MPKEVHNQLTAITVKNETRPGRHADGSGLYLVVSDTGAKQWLWRGVVHGRRRDIGMGSAGLVPLRDAPETARSWRRIAREGGDPPPSAAASTTKPRASSASPSETPS